MSSTPRLALPFLIAGQAQKEISHNESLQTLDIVAQAAVEEGPRASPPASPAIGSCYIVASGAGGDWAGKGGHLAGFTAGGWRFVGPLEGMTVFIKASGLFAVYRGGAWETGVVRTASVAVAGNQVVGARQAAIVAPTGGGTVDTECRAAVSAILGALRAHGLIAP